MIHQAITRLMQMVGLTVMYGNRLLLTALNGLEFVVMAFTDNHYSIAYISQSLLGFTS